MLSDFDDLAKERKEEFSNLDEEERQTLLFAEIHNRLAEISKFLEIGIAMFAKLSIYDLEDIHSKCQQIYIKKDISGVEEMSQDGNMAVGYESSLGLHYMKTTNDDNVIWCPLGEDDTRSCPLDETCTRFLTTEEREETKNNFVSQKEGK